MSRAAAKSRVREEASGAHVTAHPQERAAPRKRRALAPEARRAAILDAALEEFTARGYEGARLEDVAKRASIAKGTIYLYFADKEALFQELVRSMVNPVLTTLEQMRARALHRSIWWTLEEAFGVDGATFISSLKNCWNRRTYRRHC